MFRFTRLCFAAMGAGEEKNLCVRRPHERKGAYARTVTTELTDVRTRGRVRSANRRAATNERLFFFSYLLVVSCTNLFFANQELC